MSQPLLTLIRNHRHAVEVLRSTLKRQLVADVTDYSADDEAFEAEHAAMMRLVSYSPKSLEEARVRSHYLLSTRFPDALDEEGLAFVRSFLKDEEIAN